MKKMFEMIQSAVENSVENFGFDDADSYDVEMGMEYDNKVYLSHINFDGHSDLSDHIYQDIESCFGLADESDDDDESPSE